MEFCRLNIAKLEKTLGVKAKIDNLNRQAGESPDFGGVNSKNIDIILHEDELN
jgi:hypothetical protein